MAICLVPRWILGISGNFLRLRSVFFSAGGCWSGGVDGTSSIDFLGQGCSIVRITSPLAFLDRWPPIQSLWMFWNVSSSASSSDEVGLCHSFLTVDESGGKIPSKAATSSQGVMSCASLQSNRNNRLHHLAWNGKVDSLTSLIGQ